MTDRRYVHGYSDIEAVRLGDQAGTLADLLHHDTAYPPGAQVLEAGCGVGSQTLLLARRSPEADITSIDIARESIAVARERVQRAGLSNVRFRQMDLFDLDFPNQSFDHVFVCFVLEHLAEPLRALAELMRVLKPGGTITAIEGDHGSFYCHPETREAMETVQCLIRIQAEAGGDALIGRRLFPLLCEADFVEVSVSPRMVYVDSSRPAWVDGFSKKTFIAMVEGVREQALAAHMLTETAWEQGIRDLYRATEADGTFCYTFFKARAARPTKHARRHQR